MKEITATLALMLLVLYSSWATKTQAFNEQTFKQLQKENAIILVDVAADWCPTCRTQKKMLEAYFKLHPKSAVTVLRVDFDNDKQWVRYFRAPRQSTLILFRGNKQLWFSVAETRKDVLFNELDKATKTVE